MHLVANRKYSYIKMDEYLYLELTVCPRTEDNWSISIDSWSVNCSSWRFWYVHIALRATCRMIPATQYHRP